MSPPLAQAGCLLTVDDSFAETAKKIDALFGEKISDTTIERLAHQVARHFRRAVFIVDWYHASEHVWGCAKVLFGEGTWRTHQWVQQRLSLLWKRPVHTWSPSGSSNPG